MKQYRFYFIIGSQYLYGEATLRQVNEHAQIMVEGLNRNPSIPCTIVYKPCVKTSAEISAVINDANNDEACAGIITWMHTFSPSKMWIAGLAALRKPYLHVNTQFNRDIPWGDIDMNFMNLNQSAHGDREHGYIAARMRLPRKVIAGHWQDETFAAEVGAWMRPAVGAVESKRLRVMRISDNMRDVAVTEGDKIEAQLKLGWQVDHYGIGDIVDATDKVTEAEIDAQMAEYESFYKTDTDKKEAVRYQAKLEIAIKSLLDLGAFGAFHTNFQDLHGLKQLPGLAVQDLSRQGYGFAAEGDWKTAALARTMKLMAQDLTGGTAFMEDYTYHFEQGNEMILGAHMLEVCPTLAADQPKIQVHPLGIGDKEPPARAVFKAKSGKAIVVSLVDMGNRLRMIVNDIECVNQPQDMPNLPVAAVLWKPQPCLKTSAEAWILAGGAHHSVLSFDLTAQQMADFAEITGLEFIYINKNTNIPDFRKELFVNDAVWRMQ